MHINIRSALLDPRSDMATIFFAALAAVEYDVEVMAMDAEALLMEIEQGLGQKLPETNRIKLVSGCQIAFTDLAYTDEAVFNELALVTHTPETSPNPRIWEPAEAEDAAWLMIEAQLIDSDPPPYSESIWRFCGGLLALEGCTRAISTLPQAIVDQPTIDANLDPDLYASLEDQNNQVEQSTAEYVIGRLKILLGQLQKIPTQEGKPLITPQMSNEWLASLSADLLKDRQPQEDPVAN